MPNQGSSVIPAAPSLSRWPSGGFQTGVEFLYRLDVGFESQVGSAVDDTHPSSAEFRAEEVSWAESVTKLGAQFVFHLWFHL